MTRHGAISGVAALVAAASLLSGCGNGGNGGQQQGSASPLLAITAVPSDGIVPGQPSAPVNVLEAPSCASATLPLNSTITFKFDKPVTESSLPNASAGYFGPATGSIRIIDGAGNAATGQFAVVDDPLKPPGNNCCVTFSPLAPANPNAGCAAGLVGSATYTINIPQGPSTPALVVGGAPIPVAVTACFNTCFCDTATGNSAPPCGPRAFTDPIAGAPYVIRTTPETAPVPGAPVDPLLITGNTIRIVVSEPLQPSGVNSTNIIVRNAASKAQVPGTVFFFQSGSFPIPFPNLTGPDPSPENCVIEYRATSPLIKGVLYEVAFGTLVQDFGGNPLQTTQASGVPQLLFATIPATACPQTPFSEPFDTIANRSTQSGALQWATPVGFAQTTYPSELVGTGSDGPVTVNPPIAPATNTLFNTESLTVGGMPVNRQGKWDFTSFTVNAGGIARFHGPWPVHVRSTGPVTINGQIHVNAGTAATSTLAFELGARNGNLNNPVGTPIVFGGVGNAGGGTGGRASHIDTGNPLHCYFGEFGYGPSVAGVPNDQPSNSFFAGGDGGRSGFFPTVNGEPQGLGGAGGTAATIGEVGQPRGAAPACAPVGVNVPLAQPRPVTAVFIPPIALQSAGSGGGGGGDKLETTAPPTNDDQGGAGGAGGGSLRISCVGNLTMASTGVIQANGGVGGTGSQLAGHGGSGSGGQVWLQSFANVNLTQTSVIQVVGPPRLGGGAGTGCTQQSSGGGGQGLIQLEAGAGTINTMFASSAGSLVQTAPFPFAQNVVGEAVSNFFDTGSFNPDFGAAAEVKNVGNAAGAVLTIAYEGAFEAVTGGSPDLSTLKTTVGGVVGGPVITAADVATELDGYRFIRFRISVSYPSPPNTPSSAILPSVDSIMIPYTTPCP